MGKNAFNMIAPLSRRVDVHAVAHDCLPPAFAVQYDSSYIEVHWSKQELAYALKNNPFKHDGNGPIAGRNAFHATCVYLQKQKLHLLPLQSRPFRIDTLF